MAELAGVMVGNYFLLECLAREGMVEMYRARPTTRGGYDVVLRLFRPPFPDPTDFLEHFAAEVEKVWRCHHPHIVPLLEFGTGDDLLFTATLFPGMETLEQFLERQQEPQLPIAFIVRLMAQLCSAVQYAHKQDIVHGNIQPSSILLRNDGDVLLTDFSMRRAYQEGEPLAVQFDEGNSFRARRPEASEALEQVVHIALSKTAEARFPNADTLAQALLDAVVAQHPPSAFNVPQRRISVHARRIPSAWSRIATLLTLMLLLFGLLGVSVFVFSRPLLPLSPH
jgi:serine/threonine protein kinase